MTSGASETILRNFFSRSSRATGPKTRVPTGSLASLMTTAAFWSKRIYVPSRRRYSLRVRTITAFTTLPFFTVPSGEASLTAAVTTSPRPAFAPSPPPSGRITCSLRAPELSATASMVLICTAMVFLLALFFSPVELPDRLALLHGLVGRVFHLRQRRAAHNLFKRPPLQLAQRPRLADAHHVADPRRVLLVVRVKLLRRPHDALVLRVRLAHLHRDHDGLLHLGRNHLTDFLVAPRCRCRRRRRRGCLFLLCRRHLPAPFALLALAVAAFCAAVFFGAVFLGADVFAAGTAFFARLGFFSASASASAACVFSPRVFSLLMPSTRSRAIVLICAISLRSWRSFFTPSFWPIDTWKRSRNSCSAVVFSWCVSSSSLKLRIFWSSIILSSWLPAPNPQPRPCQVSCEPMPLHFCRRGPALCWKPAAAFYASTAAFSTPGRCTNLVFSGSLLAARRIASWATSGATPSISKRILPGRTTAT